MEGKFDIMHLLEDKSELIRYILGTMSSSQKFLENLPTLRQKGWSEQGMLDKVIEITAIQSDQIKHLALIALLVAQSSNFDVQVAQLMMKMGRGEEALKAMLDAKLKGK